MQSDMEIKAIKNEKVSSLELEK